jgi:hypothetical protein
MAQPSSYIMDVRNPFEQSLAGVQQALQISGSMRERDFMDQRAKLLQAQEAAAGAEANTKQAELARQQAFQSDVGAIAANPTPAALASLIVKYPEYGEKLKTAYGSLSEEQKNAKVNQASQVYAALRAGKPDIAQNLLSTQIEAMKNSGMEQDAKNLTTLSELITVSPETATTSTGLFLASAMGADKFTENFSKLEGERRAQAKEGAELTEAQAKAEKAATEAKFAESTAAMEVAKKAWDITKLQEDIAIAKENAKIAAAQVALSRENNALKRQELGLKVDEMKQKRDETVRTKVADLEGARASIDNLLNTADRVLATPLGVINAATGPVSSRLPTVSAETANFEELLSTLGSQAFLAQVPIMKGLGALSNAEGSKLESALQSLSLRQSPDRLIANIREAQRIMLKARKTMADRYGLPDTVPDTPAAASQGGAGSPDVNELVKKYTGGGGASGRY